MSNNVLTVLGPVPSVELGAVAFHERLLSVVPGAEYAYDIEIDRADVFDRIVAKLVAFRDAGGGTIVDSLGMFNGRDLRLFEALSRATGVHIVASTGMGPEENLGGYFVTPQTNPPTPWPAERFADLFVREVTEGMVVPRLERRRAAGLVTTRVTRAGATPTDESLLAAVGRSVAETGVPGSIRFGADALADLDIVLAAGAPSERVVVAGLDRRDAVSARWPSEVAERGAVVGIDNVGGSDDALISDEERADLVAELVERGHGSRIVLATSATGVAFGHRDNDIPFETVLTAFAPLLERRGVTGAALESILVDTPRDLLAVR